MFTRRITRTHIPLSCGLYTFSRIVIKGSDIYAVVRVGKQTKRGLSLSQNDQFRDVLMLKVSDRLPCLPLILAIIMACSPGLCITIFNHNWIFITCDRYLMHKVKSHF